VDGDGLLAPVEAVGASIRVSPDSKSRALRIADTAFKTLEARGHSIQWQSRHGRKELCVVIQGQSLPVRLREKLSQALHEPTKWERDCERRGETYWGTKYDLAPSGIRDFLDALESAAGETAEMRRVVGWGRAVADRIDPLRSPDHVVAVLKSAGD
jgi:hypothetical protein